MLLYYINLSYNQYSRWHVYETHFVYNINVFNNTTMMLFYEIKSILKVL